jgi:hypothetical protein
MIRMNKKSTKVLTGLFCLPTAARMHVLEPKRSSAFKAGQEFFILRATQSVDQGGYPEMVVLCADEGSLDLQVGDQPETQHAQVRKNLPPRSVIGIVRADGSTEGEMPAKGLGLPHWSFISANEDGSASQSDINEVDALITNNREETKAAKEAIRQAKKGAKSTTSSSEEQAA